MKYTVLTPRQQVETSLRGGFPGRVPFTIYEYAIPQNSVERALRNRGMCIVNRRIPVYRTVWNDVKETRFSWFEKGKLFEKTILSTPVGEITAVAEQAGFTVWQHEKFFKRKEDYKVLKFIAENEHYIPDYTPWLQAEKAAGGDVIFRAGMGLEPLQTFISGTWMSMETFCYEWMDSRDEILEIAAVVRRNRLAAAQIIADSPALHANYGGNVTPEIIGPEIFEKYYIPCYNEVADIFHSRGKLLGCHLDGNNSIIAEAVAGSQLDFIEAFTPEDTDMTLQQAREIWKNKVIWLNFPSSWHLKNDNEVTAATMDLLSQVSVHDGLIMGITEDMPAERELYSCRAIMNGLDLAAKNN